MALYTPEYKPNGNEIAVFNTSQGTIRVRLAGNDAGKAKKQKKQAVKDAKRALNPGIVAEKLEEAPDAVDEDPVTPERLSSM